MQNTLHIIDRPVPVGGKFGLSTLHELSPDALDQLNREEKQELESFTNLRRQREYMTSRLMLKELAGNLNMNKEQFAILKDRYGCPYGSISSDRLYVSIAHSGEQVFCGINRNHPIGIDLEPVGREVPPRLMRRILHPEDALLFAKMEPIRLWTIKEALVKLEGKGLRINMNEVQVQNESNGFVAELNRDKRAKICSFESNENWLAIAYYL